MSRRRTGVDISIVIIGIPIRILGILIRIGTGTIYWDGIRVSVIGGCPVLGDGWDGGDPKL
jgi:hypothetical protein